MPGRRVRKQEELRDKCRVSSVMRAEKWEGREDGRRQIGSGRLMFSVFLICVITSIKNHVFFLL